MSSSSVSRTSRICSLALASLRQGRLVSISPRATGCHRPLSSRVAPAQLQPTLEGRGLPTLLSGTGPRHQGQEAQYLTLPRTEPRTALAPLSKSRIHLSFILIHILPRLSPIRHTRTDDALSRPRLYKHDDEQLPDCGHPQQDGTVLADRMLRIRDRQRPRISECRRGLFERYAMLTQVSNCFFRIPFEFNRHRNPLAQSPYLIKSQNTVLSHGLRSIALDTNPGPPVRQRS